VKIVKQIRDNNLFELLKGSFIALLFKGLGIIIGVVFTWFIAKEYGAVGVGIYISFWSILMVASVVAKLGFDTAIVKFIAGFSIKKQFSFIKVIYKKANLWVFLSSVVLGIFIILFSKQISFLFFETSTYNNIIIIIGLLTIPLSLLSIHAESLKALKKITAFSIFQNGTIFMLAIIFIWGFCLYRNENIDVVYSLGVAILILFPISVLVWKKYYKQIKNTEEKNQGSFPFTNKEILKISIPMLLGNSLFLLMNWTDTLMLSAMGAERDVGIYNTAVKISALSSSILVAINSIAMPKYAELIEQKNTFAFRKFVKQTTLLIFILTAPILLCIFLFPEYLLGLFGEDFIEGKTALILLAIGHFFSAISGSTIHLLNMSGSEKAAQNILLISTILNIGLNLILIPFYGILGAAIATTSTTILWNLIAVIYIYNKFGFLTYPINLRGKK